MCDLASHHVVHKEALPLSSNDHLCPVPGEVSGGDGEPLQVDTLEGRVHLTINLGSTTQSHYILMNCELSIVYMYTQLYKHSTSLPNRVVRPVGKQHEMHGRMLFPRSYNYYVVCCGPIDFRYLVVPCTLCAMRHGPSKFGLSSNGLHAYLYATRSNVPGNM